MALTLADFIRQMRDAALEHPEIANYSLMEGDGDIRIGDAEIHHGSQEIRLFLAEPGEGDWLPEPEEFEDVP